MHLGGHDRANTDSNSHDVFSMSRGNTFRDGKILLNENKPRGNEDPRSKNFY